MFVVRFQRDRYQEQIPTFLKLREILIYAKLFKQLYFVIYILSDFVLWIHLLIA